ncbi:MAG: DNA polymerase III subunit delta' [Hydrogenothermaceae bacterium]
MKIIGHRKEKELIKKLLDKNYDSLSLLFEGKDCIGKKLFALYTARAYLCEKKEGFGCGECKDCRLVNNTISNIYEGTNLTPHYNIKIIQSESREIKIDQIREIIDFLQLKSEKGKVVIIEKAENMNIESSNALLKTLEEPPSNSLIILTTSNQFKLLPTILSRLKKIKFKNLSDDDIRDILTLKGLSEEKINDFLKIADGSLCLPLVILENENLYKYAKDIANLIINPKHPEGIFSLAKNFENLEVQQAVLVFDIIYILFSKSLSIGEISPNLFEVFIKEYKLAKEALLKGVKKKLTLLGLYFRLTDEVKNGDSFRYKT